MSLPEYFIAIQNHLDQFVESNDEIVVFHEKVSPDFHLDIYLIRPTEYRKFQVLMTGGVSSRPMTVPAAECNPFIELAMLLPAGWDVAGENWKLERNYWPIRLLKDLGRYPRQNNTWLGFGHTVPAGRRGAMGPAHFVASILLKSFSLPERFQQIHCGDTRIDLLTVFPLYQEELDYARAHGTNRLLTTFDEHDISDIIDVNRVNACGYSIQRGQL